MPSMWKYIIYSEQIILKKTLVADANTCNYVVNQPKIVAMKLLALSLIIFFVMKAENVAVAAVVIIINKIIRRMKNFYVIAIKHKENLFGAIIF